jgi:chromosome segregation ATPase
LDDEIKVTGQIGGKVNDEELEIRFKTLLKQLKAARGLNTFSEQLKALLDEVDKSHLASEMSYGSQLTELNQLAARISEIFVGLAKQNETNLIFNQRIHEEELQIKVNIIEQLTVSEDKLKESLKNKDLLLEELQEKFRKLEEDVPGLKARLDDQLKLIKTQDEQLQTRNDTISNQAQKIDSMTMAISQNEELKLSVNQLQEEISTLRENHEKGLQQREFEFKNEVFEKEKSLQQVFQERLEKLQDHMNDKYEERLAGIIEKHDNRVNNLLNEITDLKIINQQFKQKEFDLQKAINEIQESNKFLLEENQSLKKK